jgi:hypothetical protein
MGTPLTGLEIKDTYTGLIKTTDNGAISATAKYLSDGSGNDSSFALSTANIGIGTIAPLGILHLKKTAAATRLVIDGDAAQNKLISYRTAGVQRFGLYVNNTAESGANAGSNFAVRAYADAGTLLTTALFIQRSTGNVGIGNNLTPTSTLDVTGTLAVSGAATLGSASVAGAIDAASIETDAAETSTAAVWKLGNKGDGNVFVSALDYIIVQVAGLVIKLPLAIFPDTKDYYDRVIADSGTFEGMACYESSSTILKYN